MKALLFSLNIPVFLLSKHSYHCKHHLPSGMFYQTLQQAHRQMNSRLSWKVCENTSGNVDS